MTTPGTKATTATTTIKKAVDYDEAYLRIHKTLLARGWVEGDNTHIYRLRSQIPGSHGYYAFHAHLTVVKSHFVAHVTEQFREHRLGAAAGDLGLGGVAQGPGRVADHIVGRGVIERQAPPPACRAYTRSHDSRHGPLWMIDRRINTVEVVASRGVSLLGRAA